MKPDNDAEPLINQVRRTTIVVSDIEASLSFYRDLLGMQVWYDGVIDQDQQRVAYDLPPGTRLRVCVLAGASHGGDSALVSGMVGLMQFLDLPQPPPAAPTRRPQPGQCLLIFDTDRMREIEYRMQQAGIQPVTPPARLDVPGRKVVYEMLAYAPDGVRVSFAQNSEIGPPIGFVPASE